MTTRLMLGGAPPVAVQPPVEGIPPVIGPLVIGRLAFRLGQGYPVALDFLSA
jgi:hypothetical protein